jgi:hypothetical protein
MVKSRRARCVGHVARMEWMRNAYILVVNLTGRDIFGYLGLYERVI